METLQNMIKNGEKEHRTNLFLYRWGEKIRRSGQLAWPLLDGEEKPFRTLWSLAIRIVLVIVLFAIFKALDLWFLAIVAYGLIHLALYMVGSFMMKKHGAVLEELAGKFKGAWQDYLAQQAQQKGLTLQYPYDGRIYEDGIQVDSRGRVKIPLARNFGEILVYRNDDPTDIENREQFKERQGKYSNYLWLKEQIASVEFRKKFQVCTPAENEINCMVYFSPSTVVGYIDNKKMERINNIVIRCGELTAETNMVTERPASVDVYSFRPLGWYFQDIDRYCDELRWKCDEGHASAAPLRGPKV